MSMLLRKFAMQFALSYRALDRSRESFLPLFQGCWSASAKENVHNTTCPPRQIDRVFIMAIIRRFLKTSSVCGAASLAAFFWAIREDRFVNLLLSDHIFHSTYHRKFNPLQNPTLHDLCVRTVPLSEINPSLLENEGKLVEKFCAGVWGGWGAFALSFQR